MKSESYKKREAELKIEYENFLNTEEGQEWKKSWQRENGSEREGDFGDYLYDFHTEMLM